MDPQAALQSARCAYTAGDYSAAREFLANYREWRKGGGFEPGGGDEAASELEAKLASLHKHWDMYEFTIGSHFLSALINADESGLSDQESTLLKDFVSSAHETAKGAGFTIGHWAEGPEESRSNFARCEVTGLMGDCTDVWLMVYKESVDPPVDERELRVLSVDAWRDDGGWQWNNWHKVGTVTVHEFMKLGVGSRAKRRVTIAWFREEGYLSDESKGKVTVGDDGHNLVVKDRRSGEPLFAIEYGSVLG